MSTAAEDAASRTRSEAPALQRVWDGGSDKEIVSHCSCSRCTGRRFPRRRESLALAARGRKGTLRGGYADGDGVRADKRQQQSTHRWSEVRGACARLLGLWRFEGGKASGDDRAVKIDSIETLLSPGDRSKKAEKSSLLRLELVLASRFAALRFEPVVP